MIPFDFSVFELLLLNWEIEGFDTNCEFLSVFPLHDMFFTSTHLTFVGVCALSFTKGRVVFLAESDAVLSDLLTEWVNFEIFQASVKKWGND